MKTRKVAAFLATIMAVSSTFVGCSNGTNSSSNNAQDNSGNVTITMVESLTSPERTAVLREIADKYQESHKGVTVNIISPPLENADTKITQMLQAQQDVDIVEVRDSTLTQFATNKWIAALEKYVDQWDEKDTLTTSAKEAMKTFQNTDYLIPYGFYHRAIFYRKDWFQKAGLEAPKTWQDIYDAGKKLTDASNSKYGYSFRGGSSGYQYADTLYWSYIGVEELANPNAGYYTKEGNGKTIFTLPKVKEALHFYKSLFKDVSPKDSVAWGFSEMVQGFVGGTTAMLIQDPEVIATCSSSMKDDEWDMVAFPAGPSGEAVSPNGFAGWGLTSFSKHPDQAADFLLFLSNSENNTYFAKKYSTIPIHSDAAEKDSYFSTGKFALYLKTEEQPDVYKYAIQPQMYEAFAQYKTEVDKKYQQYLNDTITDDQLLKWLDEFWTEAYKAEGKKW
ncbi:MAG TPA: sugar ABC transporter substrate-binding protein [Clostridiales bacterium]|jgi:multiple sugar transport system substrate-binding protein|nr:sugar ABC transporter substrate-binding protein [Clostridiales bacterium]